MINSYDGDHDTSSRWKWTNFNEIAATTNKFTLKQTVNSFASFAVPID